MTAYTYGSPEAVEALKESLLSNPGDGHWFGFSYGDRKELANALETASFAGKPWFEQHFGLGTEHAGLWPDYLKELELDDAGLVGLIDALALAYELGDEFAGQWLAGLSECTDDVEWI